MKNNRHFVSPAPSLHDLAHRWCLTNGRVCAQSLGCVQLFTTPWTVTLQAPLSVESPRQEYWSKLPYLPPRGSSRPKDGSHVFCVSFIGRWIPHHRTNLFAKINGLQQAQDLICITEVTLSCVIFSFTYSSPQPTICFYIWKH